jgi:hypothetical protein
MVVLVAQRMVMMVVLVVEELVTLEPSVQTVLTGKTTAQVVKQSTMVARQDWCTFNIMDLNRKKNAN